MEARPGQYKVQMIGQNLGNFWSWWRAGTVAEVGALGKILIEGDWDLNELVLEHKTYEENKVPIPVSIINPTYFSTPRQQDWQLIGKSWSDIKIQCKKKEKICKVKYTLNLYSYEKIVLYILGNTIHDIFFNFYWS